MNQADPTHSSPPPAAVGTSSEVSESARGRARIIKRYSNRKLYDTVESRYVTLPQIAEMVRKGEDVRIIDNNSKEDLTSVTLAQILYEEERKQSRAALPLGALKDLIHASGERIMSTLRDGPVGKLIGGSRSASAESAPEEAPTESVPPPPETPRAAGRFYTMIETSRESIQEFQHRIDEQVRKVAETLWPANAVERLEAEIKRLAQRVETLESQVANRPPSSSLKE